MRPTQTLAAIWQVHAYGGTSGFRIFPHNGFEDAMVLTVDRGAQFGRVRTADLYQPHPRTGDKRLAELGEDAHEAFAAGDASNVRMKLEVGGDAVTTLRLVLLDGFERQTQRLGLGHGDALCNQAGAFRLNGDA